MFDFFCKFYIATGVYFAVIAMLFNGKLDKETISAAFLIIVIWPFFMYQNVKR